LRYWVPIGGSDFAGDVVRYGLGLSYPADRSELWCSPVVELVGWTVLSGKQVEASSPTDFMVERAAGVTVVNAKVGMRVGWEDVFDVYVGYGRALTGLPWYRDLVRVELRWFY